VLCFLDTREGLIGNVDVSSPPLAAGWLCSHRITGAL
jgi:hypothetical protein